jgi:hypothetical protein
MAVQAKQQSTFVGWDFDNVWRISPSDYPRLRALTQGTITIDAGELGISAPNVSKVYDGVAVNTVSDLAALSGWGDGFTASGVLGNDNTTLNAIKNSITYGGDWVKKMRVLMRLSHKALQVLIRKSMKLNIRVDY